MQKELEPTHQTVHTPQTIPIHTTITTSSSNPLLTWTAFFVILLNCVVRSVCPSLYVPARATCTTWIGSPYIARIIATFAEYFFYRQVTFTLDIQHLWTSSSSPQGGWLFWLWVFGETLSWIGLLFQNSIANALEDTLWCVWFTCAFCMSSHWSKYILVPVILYYVVVHLPSLIPTIQPSHLIQWKWITDVEYVDSLGVEGNWVVPSVVAKFILFLILVYINEISAIKQ